METQNSQFRQQNKFQKALRFLSNQVDLLRPFRRLRFFLLYRKYSDFTMIGPIGYVANLEVVNNFRHLKGPIVECGVWRGGMSGGMAQLLGEKRKYYLFDSFEGLPDVQDVDGEAAIAWQNNKDSEDYLDNCRAEMSFAQNCMAMSPAKDVSIVKGWFSESLPEYDFADEISILRLDGDWYESTMDCLVHLYPKVEEGGVVIIDDYYVWDGCSRAVHDYLSANKLPVRIEQSSLGIGFIVKTTGTKS